MPRLRCWRRAKSTTTRGPLNRKISVLRASFAGIAYRTNAWAQAEVVVGVRLEAEFSDHAL